MNVRAAIDVLVGNEYQPADLGPEHGCWALVRDGYRLLGVDMPQSHVDAFGAFEKVDRNPRPGDVVIFDSSGEQHVTLVVDSVFALHLGPDRCACLSRLAPLLASVDRVRVAQPKGGLPWSNS